MATNSLPDGWEATIVGQPCMMCRRKDTEIEQLREELKRSVDSLSMLDIAARSDGLLPSDFKAEIETLRDVIRFALSHVVARNAGTLNDPFSYLWQKDWDEFERMAKEVTGE
jgi:hypothetical protein